MPIDARWRRVRVAVSLALAVLVLIVAWPGQGLPATANGPTGFTYDRPTERHLVGAGRIVSDAILDIVREEGFVVLSQALRSG